MKSKNRHLAIIPARSGSKGLPNKNIMLMNGKPLLAYTIEAAINSKIFDYVFVSTDSEEYAHIAIECGAEVPFLREETLSNDNASTWDVVIDSIQKLAKYQDIFDTVTVLQPTSPLRNQHDIKSAFDLMEKLKANSIISVCPVDHSPLWTNTLPNDLSLKGFIKNNMIDKTRQKLETYYRINGAIYIVKIESLFKNRNIYEDDSFAYIMDKENSIDIDDIYDFKIAEQFLKIGI